MVTGTEIGAINVRIGADLSGLTNGLAQAGRTIGETTAGLRAEFSIVESSVRTIFDGIGSAISRAAETGKFSFRDMVDSILDDLQRLAVRKFITEPLDRLLDGVLGAVVPGGGARAAGGPVMPGRAFLVGEQGPEMFVPAAAGRILPNGALPRTGPHVVVNIHARDADSVLRSESQIAAMMNRVVARGARNL